MNPSLDLVLKRSSKGNETVRGSAVCMAAIEAFCSRWDAEEVALLGPVLRDDFGSDIDILARCRVARTPGLVAVTTMEHGLAELLAWRVDPVFRAPIEESRNNFRREVILESVHGANVT